MQVERRLTRRELAALGSFATQRPIDPSESEAERLKTVANVSAMNSNNHYRHLLTCTGVADLVPN